MTTAQRSKLRWGTVVIAYVVVAMAMISVNAKPAIASTRGCYCQGFECDIMTPGHPYDRWCCENWLGEGTDWGCGCSFFVSNCIDGET